MRKAILKLSTILIVFSLSCTNLFALTGREELTDLSDKNTVVTANEEIRKVKKDVSDTSDSLTTLTSTVNSVNVLTTLGDILYYATANTRLAGNTTATKKFLSQTGTGAVSAAPVWDTVQGSKYVGTFTKATTDSTGTVDYTDAGFQPSVVIFICSRTGTTSAAYSFGVDDNVGQFAVYALNGTANNITTSFSIYDDEGGATYSGQISAFLSNGFTILWTRGGAPSSNLGCGYLALTL